MEIKERFSETRYNNTTWDREIHKQLTTLGYSSHHLRDMKLEDH